MRTRPFAAAAAALAALLACARREALSARDSTFVAAMVELRALPEGGGADSAARRAVLTRRGLTPDSLEAIAAELADDPERAANVWVKIDQGAAAASVPAIPAFPPRDSASNR